MRHADEAESTHTVKTPFGTFYVCAACVEHLGTDAFPPQRHPLSDTRGCECEHVCHFQQLPVTVNLPELRKVVDELQALQPLTVEHLCRIFGALAIMPIVETAAAECIQRRQREDLYRAAAITGALAMQAHEPTLRVDPAAILESAEAIVTGLREKGILS